MKCATQLFLIGISWLSVPGVSLRAQLVADGATVTLANVTNHFTGSVTVGTDGAFTLLVLSDHAQLTNSAHGVISRNATARSNAVHLVSPSASWLMGGTLLVGSNGSFSTLVVSNGALVRANAGIIGRQSTSVSNVVLVTGAGSMWSNVAGFVGVGLTVGSQGSGNHLIVSNGGWIVNSGGGGAIGSNSSNNVARITGAGSVWSNSFALDLRSSGAGNGNNRLVIEDGGQVFNLDGSIDGLNGGGNNSALVTGTGAVWNNGGDLRVGISARSALVVSNSGTVLSVNGYVGQNTNRVLITGSGSRWSNQHDVVLLRGNTLTATNGGWLINSNGYVGGNTPGVLSSSNNAVVVTGADSVWSNRADLFVGFAGNNNRLVASNGAIVAANNLFTGFHPTSLDNRVTVDGGTLRVTNLAGNGTLDVRRGTNVLDAGLVEVDQLLVTNSTGRFAFNGGRLITRGAVIGQRFFVGNSVTPAIWDARAGDHRLANDLFIGNNSPFNQMLVTDGATIINDGAGLIGGGSGAHSNTVFVSGSGSQWLFDEEDSLYVGYSGVFNRLFVTNGGVVETASCIVGGENNATNCEAVITGPGSVLSSALAALQIGSTGSTNRVRIESGGLLRGDFQVGRTIHSVGNVLWVADPGSRAQTSSQFVGYDGPASVLMISNGAIVQGVEAVVGLNASSGNNIAHVTGSGSAWNNAATLHVGSGGRSNQLLVSDGGVVRDRLSYVGFNSTSSGNRAMVTGPGSLWSNQFELYLGFGGAGNQLVVSEGGAVRNSIGIMGLTDFSSSNLAVVTGKGSVWSNTSEFYLGFGGGGNRLVVSDGAALYNSIGTMGSGVFSSNNLAVVTGAGSVWTNLDKLYVGLSGRGNQLVVSNGGTVFATFNRNVGENGGANSNSVLVTDAGSAWLGNDRLYIGSGGAFNRLLVKNGGRVTSGPGTIGGLSGAKSNRVELVDAGSVWINHSDLTVGEAGEYNQLVVSNGALLVNSNGIIGFGAAGDSNTALVSGGGSVWSNQQTLTIGDSGSGNQLEVSQGARVESRFATLGSLTSAKNNRAVVTGPDSSWRIEQTVRVGYSGSGNRLVISDGAVVAAGGSGAVLTIGDGLNSANNEVLITGPGSIYRNTSGINIEVGNQGSSNCMRIENGGLLMANPIIGGGPTSTGNVLIVTGPGSQIFVPRDDIELIVGANGSGNFLVVSNGAVVSGDGAAIGYNTTSSNNLAVVIGSGSAWSNQNVIQVGSFGRNNRLFIADGGTVSSTNAVNIGFRTTTSSNNWLHVANGTLRVTNLVGTGTLDVRSGTNRLDAGVVDVDRLTITNARGYFEFNGGTLRTAGTTIGTGQIFNVGNGASTATLELRGGTHVMLGGIVLANRGSLTGSGSVPGSLTVQAGGRLIPGTSVGKIIFNISPSLQGTVVMEISRNGPALTNDQIQVVTALTYGGSLIVSNSGPDALVSGDRFRLFAASAYSGSFTNLSLPPLGPGLHWRNDLTVDGAISVVAVSPPGFSAIGSIGTNVVIAGTNGTPNAPYTVLAATNVALPLSNWVSLATNQFNAGGGFTFTNSRAPGIPQRFFQLRTP